MKTSFLRCLLKIVDEGVYSAMNLFNQTKETPMSKNTYLATIVFDPRGADGSADEMILSLVRS